MVDRYPIVGIIGARQIGKTTLAREIARRWEGPASSFDLEDPSDLARLADPMLALRELVGLVVIDEIQEQPGLFPESLAGRIYYHELRGFGLDDTEHEEMDRLWLRGGFPRLSVSVT